jgi:HK97 family phage major capsid protein
VIPRQTVAPGAIAWGYGEMTASNKVNNNTFGRMSVKPHRMSAFASLSTDILNESRLDIASIIQDDLQAQINLEKQIVLLGAGGGDVPVGLDGSGITAYAPVGGVTYAAAREHILKMAASISSKNAQKPRQFFKLLMNENTKTAFELVKRDAGSNVFLCENDKIEGMQVVVSNAIADNVVYCGDWSMVMMPDFFGASVHIDPNYKGGLRDIVFEMWFDVGVKRPDHFVKALFA